MFSTLFSVLNENLKGDLNKALEITWKGILAIFVVIAIVIVVVLAMSYVTKKIEDAKKKKEELKNSQNSTNE